MPLKRYDVIRKNIINQFKKEFPGEQTLDTPFSIYILHLYVELLELQEIGKELLKSGKKW